MNARTLQLRRFSAAVCAAVITAVSAWMFVSATASVERDPFQLARTMAANGKVRVAQSVESQRDHRPKQVRAYELPDLLVPPPACLKGCV